MIALEAVATDARRIRGPQSLYVCGALEESHAEAELRDLDAALGRTQATVPTITAMTAVG